MGAADADVSESAGDADGDGAALVDAVASDAVVRGAVGRCSWCRLGQGPVSGGWGCVVRQGAVWPVLVVVGDEHVEQVL